MSKTAWLPLITDRQQIGPVQAPEGVEPRHNRIEGIRAVVFDVYGTLFSSGVGDISLATEENRDAALRKTLSENQVAIQPGNDAVRFDDLLHDIIDEHQDDRRKLGIEYPEVDIRRVWEDFLQMLEKEGFISVGSSVLPETLAIDYETRVNPTQAMPGLEETLAELKAFGPMSMISNAQFYTPLLFEAFLGADIATLGFVDSCNVWSYTMLEGKPSKNLYSVAAERLKSELSLAPEACLYVGNDMRNDIWPAQALGFKTALFAGDRLSLRLREEHPACKNISPDVIVTSLKQLLPVVGL